MAKLNSGGETVGVYVSVPFCRAKCSFCNFASGVSSAERIERYVGELCVEMDAARGIAERMRGRLPEVLGSLYFGGGTPSLLEPRQLDRIFAVLRRRFAFASGAEITMEAAPGQITDDVLAAAIQCGVNRVSLGVQSFVDVESAAVGRTHTGEQCLAEIARLRAAGIAEVGVDLIAGLPHQTTASWQTSLEALRGSGATHVSVYMLEVDEGSRLGLEVLAGGVRYHAHAVPRAEASAEMYEQACAWLSANSFAQYEISNFAMGGREHESRHNRRYWERAPYVGFGVDAHSMLRGEQDDVRWANADEVGAYRGAVTEREVTHVDADAAFEESLFLGLRLNEGVSVPALREEFGNVRVQAASESVREMVDGGFMEEDGERWWLTMRGRMVSNEVFERLLVEEAAARV